MTDLLTPGPWITRPRNDGLLNIYHAAGTHDVALCVLPADASLITAAPDLLAALEGMLEWARRVKGANPGMEVANAGAAIAKVRGAL